MDLSYRLGYRAVKTAIAVFACLLLGYLLNRTAAFAVIAAILCIQPTYDKSKHTGLHRILGTIIGSLFSFIPLELAAVLPHYADYLFLFILPALILVLIFLCNILGIKDSVGPSCVIFTAIVLLHSGTTLDTLPYVLTRTAETVVGVLIALPINRFLFNPKQLPPCGKGSN
ncbi:FUSC family protein [Christensenella timonensis]|uniref:FUSC family protein n=1 Tax=Christensenella timonensis TaxID=1816678 RepID=UPI0008354F61|nr:aromatic acid exporter family protein [Christensenella timonensis]